MAIPIYIIIITL